ncbi:hypothetical protein LTR67_011143 [Exophiala xenobiotica]
MAKDMQLLLLQSEKYLASQETNETAWSLAHGTDLSVFQYFEKHPSRMKRFMGAMRLMSEREGFDLKYLVCWKALGKGLLVDVGGSFGIAVTPLPQPPQT